MARTWLILLAAILLTVLFGWKLPSLRVDNTPALWLPTESAGLHDLKEFRSRFGEDSYLLAYVSGDNLAAREAEWQQLITGLFAVPGVAAVFAPSFVNQESDGPPMPLRHYLTSQDGKYAGLIIVQNTGLPVTERNGMVDRLEAFFAGNTSLGTFHLAGADVITHDLDAGSRRSLLGFSPMVLAMMCLVLYIASREWRAVVVSLLSIVLISIWCLGLQAYAGRPLNLVVVTLPAILAVVSMTQIMHILARFHQMPTPSRPTDHATRVTWWRDALHSTFRPNLLCAVTTAAGFASLGTSRIPPLRELGLLAAVGVMFSFALSYSLVPALLAASSRVLPRGAEAHPWWTMARAVAYTDWLTRRGPAIIGVSIVVSILALAGMRQLRVESFILEFFSPSHRVPTDYHIIEQKLLGLTPIELVVEGDPSILLTDRTLEAYRDLLQTTLRDEPLVKQVVSILLEPTRNSTLEFSVPPAELRKALAEEGVPAGAGAFLHVEGGRYFLRTTLLTATDSSSAAHALVKRMRERIAQALPSGVTARVTGSTTLLIEGQVLLLETQIWSFVAAFAAIAIVILIAFRSLPFALLALPPNLVPIGVTLGLMGFANIPLNTATVTVAGIALGLVVDDTIHIMHNWIQQQRSGANSKDAVTRALFEIGNPAVMTSMAFGAGFGVFAFAPFRPTMYFGLLIAMTAITGLFCDVVLFPAMLLRLGKKR